MADFDTAAKRLSGISIGMPWRGLGCFPTGTVDEPQRAARLYLYSGIPFTTDTPPPPAAPERQTGAGKSKRTSRKKAFVVEIDGEDFIVNSEAEAQNLLDKVRETAAENAAEVTQRAAAAATKPKRKVLADARKALETPSIRVPQEFASAAADTLAAIESIYREAMQAVEIGYMMRKLADEQEEEDLLLLML